MTCSTCYDMMFGCDSISLDCNHKFHKQCIHKWLTTGDGEKVSKCPMCRSSIEIALEYKAADENEVIYDVPLTILFGFLSNRYQKHRKLLGTVGKFCTSCFVRLCIEKK